MPTCFVMQPFDGDKYDKRYDDAFKPAIIAAGLEPYRVDRDAASSVPISDIERGIQDAAVCLADISENNPNVWFELGYAFACKKEVVLICSDERKTPFPFDIQHRTIIKYKTGSSSDFQKLKKDITVKLKAYFDKKKHLASSIPVIKQVTTSHGLAEHEVVALAVLAASLGHPDDNCPAWSVKHDMAESGYTNVAAAIAMKSLEKQGYLKSEQFVNMEAQESYFGYTLTEKGWDWVLENQKRFKLKQPISGSVLEDIDISEQPPPGSDNH